MKKSRWLIGAALIAAWGAPDSMTTHAQAHPRKPRFAAARAPGPSAVSQDVGNIAVVVDNGLLFTTQNVMDVNGVTVRFQPTGNHLYSASKSAAALDPVVGPALTFGIPNIPFPGDDDSQLVAFPAGFPFFGTTYTSVWVNTDGNITFGAPDFASNDRDKARHALGPPRVTAFLNDWSPLNALNPVGQGSIHAAVKANPSRLVVTWNGVTDWNYGGSSTFQITLFSSGAIDIALAGIDPVSGYGVTGIAEGAGAGPIQNIDLSSVQAGQALQAGVLMEAFATYTWVSDQEIAREFYRTHPDRYDYLTIFTDFSTNDMMHARTVSNQVHGIGAQINPGNGEPYGPGIFDETAAYGSAGELETIVFMNNIHAMWGDADRIVNPPIEVYGPNSNIIRIPEFFGWPTTFDGQTMLLNRIVGTLPQDGGEFSRHFDHGGSHGLWIISHMAIMAQEVEHRYGASLRFVHPTKGTGFDSYDLLGRDAVHWSYFMNTASGEFSGPPRSSGMEGNHILDLGTIASYNGAATNLAPGERVFVTAPTGLIDGYSPLDQYLMGLRRAEEVGPFFYVDEPRSIYTGQSLDPFNPEDPLGTSVTMRGWQPQGGIVFAGKRVDLTVQNIQAFEKIREKGDNPQGRRFWGPKGNLTVRYFSDTGHVDPAGNASIVLSAAQRELGDEADKIGADGKPVDVKTMAFILLVKQGLPLSHPNAINQVNTFRQAWQQYGNGPATGGRGKFDTSLNPVVY